MSRFLVLNRYRKGQGPTEGTPAHDEEMRDWGLLNRALEESGDLVWSLALAGTEEAPEGTFALYLLDVGDRSAAERWAARMPTAAYGTVEVRSVLEGVG